MNELRTAFVTKLLAAYLVATLISVSAFAAPAEAMLLPAPRVAGGRAADLALVQRTLESRVLQQHLQDYGLTAEQAFDRLGSLPDEQVHQLASRIEALQAGGKGRHEKEVLLIALVVLLVILIIIIVRHSPAEADALA